MKRIHVIGICAICCTAVAGAIASTAFSHPKKETQVSKEQIQISGKGANTKAQHICPPACPRTEACP